MSSSPRDGNILNGSITTPASSDGQMVPCTLLLENSNSIIGVFQIYTFFWCPLRNGRICVVTGPGPGSS